jgi:Tol biopolymer transport system component
MRITILKLLVIFVYCSWGLPLIAQQAILNNIRPVSDKGVYTAPIWSPDGTKLLFTDQNYAKLYIMYVDNNHNIDEITSGQGIGYKARWTSNGDSVIFKEKKKGLGNTVQIEFKKIDISTKKMTIEKGLEPDNFYMSQKVNGKNNARGGNTIVYINHQTLKLEVKAGNNGTPRVISKEQGQFYHPLVSPDGKEVIVHEGANIYVYSVDGNAKRKDLGIGLANSWMPDGSGIITFEDKSDDGHVVSGSELYLIMINDSSKRQLTYTDDVIEIWPDVSPDGRKIAFADEKTGRIFIADINL